MSEDRERFDVTNKVVVVTGAAGGQGAAEVRALLESGAFVVAADLDVSSIAANNEKTESLKCVTLDVSNPDGWVALADVASKSFGHVDALVNNAGVTLRTRLGQVDLEEWNRVFSVNVTGAMLGIQTLLPLMGEGSSIINVGSLAATNAHYTVAYTSSKWALRGLSRVASLELGPRGIRVNLVNPGYIDTPMTQSAPEAFAAANVANTPLGRLGVVEDIVPLVLFLISDSSSFISGAEIPVDGGQGAHGGVKYLNDLMSGAARLEL
jgi:3alpha(or 20beta)-hydroxysteroid dehydrogenase